MVKKKWIVRDPHFYWKIVNMILAAVILVLSVLVLQGSKSTWILPAALLAGAILGALEGILQLSKGRRFLGYIASVFAGVMVVALLLSLLRIFWFS